MDLAIAISNAQSFSELLPIVKQAEEGVKLSYLGRRYVVASDYTGEAPIDALAEKVMELIKKNMEFSDQERTFGKELAPRIDHIYDLSDEQVQQCKCITSFFIWLRNLPYNIWMMWTCGEGAKGSRWEWRDCIAWNDIGYNKSFEYYTRKQFVEKFGYPPEKVGRGYHSGSLFETGFPERWSEPTKILNPLRV